MRTLCGDIDPLRSPLNAVNWYPGEAVVLTATLDPESNQPVGGAMLPPVPAIVVKRYWVVKFAVNVAGEAVAV
jgi:hypothetical protein